MRAILACDLDGTLVGDPAALAALLARLAPLRRELGLVYATGRGLASTRALMREAGLPVPDALVAEVGAAVHFPPRWERDRRWSRHLDQRWDPRQVQAAARKVEQLRPQPAASQAYFKCSYELTPGAAGRVLPALDELLAEGGLEHQLVYSSGLHLDVLPRRAGKGRALRYVAKRLHVPTERVLACGDSGNDRDLLAHGGPAALVGNALEELRAAAPVGAYQARAGHAAGVLEALEHFGWLGASMAKPPDGVAGGQLVQGLLGAYLPSG